MKTGRVINLWTLIIAFLLVVVAIGSIIAWAKHGNSQPIEILLTPRQELSGEIYVGGEVSNPGYYPFETNDSIDEIIRAAGGMDSSANLSQLKLHIPVEGEAEPSQKVNLNRADAWLLEALPGIGETRANAIIDYRRKNGFFHNINELMKVEGISTATYEKIKDLITVADQYSG